MHRAPLSIAQMLGYVLSGILGILFLVYVFWQARFLIAGPQVVLVDEPAVVQTNRSLTLAGETRNITAITINDRPIVTDENGVFNESIILENGYTIVSIKARDRYGRETTVERPYVFVPQTLLQ